MSNPMFPNHVVEFLNIVEVFLSRFHLEISLCEEIEKNQSKIFKVEAIDGPVDVIVHRTSGSMDDHIGEYRVRVIAKLDENFTNLARNKQDFINRLATFGAIDSSAECVICQCLIPDRGLEVSAGMLAVAIAHARRSLVVSNSTMLSNTADNQLEKLSAWGDIDFEMLNYDNMHLNISNIERRNWVIPLFTGGFLQMSAIHDNPYWGGGLLCLLRERKDVYLSPGEYISSDDLNTWANLIGVVPTFGAWCSDEDDFVFAQFIPNFMKGLPDLLQYLAWQGRMRSMEIKTLIHAERNYRVKTP
jgi:hypothetical protein